MATVYVAEEKKYMMDVGKRSKFSINCTYVNELYS